MLHIYDPFLGYTYVAPFCTSLQGSNHRYYGVTYNSQTGNIESEILYSSTSVAEHEIKGSLLHILSLKVSGK